MTLKGDLNNFKGGVINLLSIWILCVTFSWHENLEQIFNRRKVENLLRKDGRSWYAYRFYENRFYFIYIPSFSEEVKEVTYPINIYILIT